MCDPVTIGMSLAGMAFSALTAPKAPKAPKMPTAPAAPPGQAKQDAKAPEVDELRQRNAARGAGSGYSTNQSTLLTGPMGENEDELNLGKTTVLGG